MNDSDDYLQVKRGRPKKFTEDVKRKIPVMPISSSLAMSRLYSDLQKSYTKENYNQKLRNMILKVPYIVKLPNNILQLQLQNFLEESVKQLMISELELVGFTLVLDRVDINNLDIPSEELLKLCFFISKNIFEGNQDILNSIKSSLKGQFKNFETNLMRLSPVISFTIADVNKRYDQMEKYMYSNINYSYYVDDIIRLSPPYQVSDKKSIKNGEEAEKKTSKYQPRQPKLEIAKDSVKKDPSLEEVKNDQQSALDYYNLMPLEDNEFYLNPEGICYDKPIRHPFEFLNDEIPDLDNDDDLEMLLSFS